MLTSKSGFANASFQKFAKEHCKESLQTALLKFANLALVHLRLGNTFYLNSNIWTALLDRFLQFDHDILDNYSGSCAWVAV